MEAINSPTGIIAEAMFCDPRKNNLNAGQGFPLAWLNYIALLLSLPEELRRHAFVILFHNLNWLYAVDPTWTSANLLPVFDSDDTRDRDAAWSGFLWGAQVPNRELYMRLKEHMLAFAADPLPSRRSYVEIIAGMLLVGWGSIDETTGEQCVSNDEMRILLLNVDDDFRSRVLWQVRRWVGETNENSHEKWAGKLSELIRIWPRQLSARSPDTSARLCELAFSSAEQFPLISELVLPLLTKIDRGQLMLPELRRSGENIVDRYPEQALALLYAVLPENALAWPYGMEATLHRIGEADTGLNTDERLVALKRKWDAR